MKKLLGLLSEEVTKAFVECGYDEKYGHTETYKIILK